MDPRHLFLDPRLVGGCAYCGRKPNTRDHVPSKALLDDPMPDNLPVVPACKRCNQKFSLDEEYVACLLECVLCGSVNTEELQREKVKKTLSKKPGLASMLYDSRRTTADGPTVWVPDEDRVRNVVLKLGRGHAAYELSSPQLDEPIEARWKPLVCMSLAELHEFERAGAGEPRGWPEIGNRAFLRACGAEPHTDPSSPWVQVQESRYRYSIDQFRGVVVRMVLAEYLACEVEWE